MSEIPTEQKLIEYLCSVITLLVYHFVEVNKMTWNFGGQSEPTVTSEIFFFT